MPFAPLLDTVLPEMVKFEFDPKTLYIYIPWLLLLVMVFPDTVKSESVAQLLKRYSPYKALPSTILSDTVSPEFLAPTPSETHIPSCGPGTVFLMVLEEMLMLWLANLNPAFSAFIELFDDSDLEKKTSYFKMMESLLTFFSTQPVFGPEYQNLIDMLRSPAIAAPHSLTGQLEYIRENGDSCWANISIVCSGVSI
jgi:hypothetical protein